MLLPSTVRALSSAVAPAGLLLDRLAEYMGDNPDLLNELKVLRQALARAESQAT